jgi:TrmH family RNA methyltransferase
MRLEGWTLVEEALAAHISLIEVALSKNLAESAAGQVLLRRLQNKHTPVRLFGERLLASLSSLDSDQGVLAVARCPETTEDRLFGKTNPLIIVGVALQNPGNVGALLRTAEAAGASGACLSQGSADPFSWKALRGAMGSAFRLPHLHGLEPGEILKRLQRRGIVNVAATARGGRAEDEIDWTRPSALWVGNEASGLDQELVARIDERVSIRLAPPVESLNVAVAAGVVLFEAARQRRVTPS